MSPYDREHRKDFGLDVRTNPAVGRAFTNVDYFHAQRMRTRAIDIFNTLLQDVDCIITPATAITSPVIPKDTLPEGESDLAMLPNLMRFVTPANLTGHPAISVPIGFDAKNMPVGLQFIGGLWEEALLLKIAAGMEEKIEPAKPTVFTPPC